MDHAPIRPEVATGSVNYAPTGLKYALCERNHMRHPWCGVKVAIRHRGHPSSELAKCRVREKQIIAWTR